MWVWGDFIKSLVDESMMTILVQSFRGERQSGSPGRVNKSNYVQNYFLLLRSYKTSKSTTDTHAYCNPHFSKLAAETKPTHSPS